MFICPKNLIAYLAHPVGDGPDREQNLANIEKWFLAIFRACDKIAINVPWYIYVRNLTEADRERAMRDDLMILGTCGTIILIGGRISAGMGIERCTAIIKGLKVLDLTDLGYEPPKLDDVEAMKALALRLQEMLK